MSLSKLASATIVFPLLALCTQVASAQRTWIVDGNRGPGYDQVTLFGALFLANPGDTILVRPGSYFAGQTNKGVRIIGGPGVLIDQLRVDAVPAGQTFSLRSVRVDESSSTMGSLIVWNCLGRVHLDEITSGSSYGSPRVLVYNSASVTINNSKFLRGIECRYSSVALTSCELAGDPAQNGVYHGKCFLPSPGWPAAEFVGSTAVLTDVTMRGGNGVPANAPCPAMVPAPAVSAASSRIVIAGDATSRFVAGADTGKTQSPIPAIRGKGGGLLLDPRVQLVDTNGGGRYYGFQNAYERPLPALRGKATFAKSIVGGLLSEKGHLAVTFLGLPTNPIDIPIGQLWIDPTAMLVVDTTVFSQTSWHMFSVPLPSLPALRGLPLVLQSAAGPSLGLETSTPLTVVIDQ